ncbi:DMT family transporter [Rickettsiales endosymbiont of Stachyamoeba lipophora]|uniref:DMT family transporter n=1 Tax=Rickettsiales endosymbiont of Stachyamoeba lipophora TaxID=2486578 RepID=UPI000F648125|nr:DMT family transporter [Rickettsiales endosymbiont of Stachyamoeba lipophora]AZL15104.1 DMT family transporter [Rickettsiales endosymbiont of Stachyamoeba lipophora]
MHIPAQFSEYNKAILNASLSAFFYGLMAFFIVKLHKHAIPVEVVLFWRFALAIIVIIALKPTVTLNLLNYHNPQYLKLFFISLIFFTGSSFFFFKSVVLIGSGLAITIFFLFPIFVIFYEWLINKQKIHIDIFISMVIMLVGLTLIHDNHSGSNKSDLGVVLAICSGFCYGSYIFLSKKFTSQVNSYNASTVICLSNTIGFLILNLILGHQLFGNFDLSIWGHLFGISFFSTALALLFLIKALAVLSATKVSILTMLEPVVTIIIGTALLNEKMSKDQIVGTLLILISSLIVTLSSRFKKIKTS